LEEAPKENMIDWILQLHTGKTKLDETTFHVLPPSVLKFLGSPDGLGFPKVHSNPEFWEMASSHLMINALRMGGRRLPTEPNQFVTPRELVENFDCFDKPVIFKEALVVNE